MDTRRPRFRNLARGTPKDEKKSKIKSGSPTHSRFNSSAPAKRGRGGTEFGRQAAVEAGGGARGRG